MTLVVDASAAVKWVVQESGRPDALRYAAGERLVAPDFVLAEVANILWKKLRLGQLNSEQAERGLAFVSHAYERLLATEVLIGRSLKLAEQLDHPVYDCLYLACAEAEDAGLLTADRRLSEKAGLLLGKPTILVGETNV